MERFVGVNCISLHGMLIILGIEFLLLGLPGVTVSLNMESETIVFGIANGITNLLLIGAISDVQN